MPIVSGDILYRLSGGSANASQVASLGGAKSTTTAASGAFFDDVTSTEATAGDVEYRCFYVHNNHGTLSLTTPVVWIQTNTPSVDTSIDIGIGTSAVNAVEQTVANENTAPVGITFSAPLTFGAGLALGDIPAGQHRAVWVRRTINAAAAAAADSFTLRVQGDTLP
jgi:hypothetical protein